MTAADIRPLPMEEVDTAFRPEPSNKAELRSKPMEKTIKLRHSELGGRSGQELDDDGAECSAKIFGM